MKVKQTVNLPHDDLEWYLEAYPGISLSATLTLLLRSFRQIHVDIGATPLKIARDAGKEVKGLISDGIFHEE